MDYLTEIENELANFSHTLYEGINKIQQNAEKLDQSSRIQFINALSADLLASHTSVTNSIGKIPEEIFTNSREAQENEIKLLELKYEQSVSRLEKLQTHAKNIFQSLEQNLDSLS